MTPIKSVQEALSTHWRHMLEIPSKKVMDFSLIVDKVVELNEIWGLSIY